ncbi:MAG: DUF1501 domain-containing protein [Aureliella sp.]
MSLVFDSFSRRDLLRITAASLAGISTSAWMSQLLRAAEGKRPHKACIMLWMSGGPSQLETLDPKPGHPNGGPTKAIKTAVPGIEIADNLPQVAKQMRDMALIRTMKTGEGDHGRATQLMMTGYKPMGAASNYPVLGSLVAQRLQKADSPLPGFVSIAPSRLGSLGSAFLGPRFAPLQVSGDSRDPNTRANLTVENLQSASANAESMAERQFLLQLLRGSVPAASTAAGKHAAIYDSAQRMMETQGEGAFNLNEEPDALRDAYGRSRFGQGCLLARRLVERGVPFIEVALDAHASASWDSHVSNFTAVTSMCEALDPAWSTLIEDLRKRDLLESTLVVWMGEFGRTPKINPAVGRDHFPDAWSVALAGGGVRGGQVIGKTAPDGMSVKDRPVTAPELFATLLEILGIDSTSSNQAGDRPIPLVDKGRPIEELIS